MDQVQWDDIAETLEYGFKWPASDPWGDARERVYQRVLGGYPHEPVQAALGKLMLRGEPWGPAIAEIAAALEHDPGLPSWDEVSAVLFAAPHRVRRLGKVHPAMADWIGRQGGLNAIRRLPVAAPDGHWELKRLRESWAEHREQWTDRRHHTIALGRGDGQLKQLQPLAAAGLAPSAPQIGAAA
jgi:hypothetical protein